MLVPQTRTSEICLCHLLKKWILVYKYFPCFLSLFFPSLLSSVLAIFLHIYSIFTWFPNQWELGREYACGGEGLREFRSGGGDDLNAIYTCMIFLNNKYEIYSLFESQIGTYVYIVKFLLNFWSHSLSSPAWNSHDTSVWVCLWGG